MQYCSVKTSYRVCNELKCRRWPGQRKQRWVRDPIFVGYVLWWGGSVWWRDPQWVCLLCFISLLFPDSFFHLLSCSATRSRDRQNLCEVVVKNLLQTQPRKFISWLLVYLLLCSVVQRPVIYRRVDRVSPLGWWLNFCGPNNL